MNKILVSLSCLIWIMLNSHMAMAQGLPKLLTDKSISQINYLPDYSYAGYHYSEEGLPEGEEGSVLNVSDFGAVADDGLDDTKAVRKALEVANTTKGKVIIQFGSGRYILSDILDITRSHLILRGAGSGSGGTILYYPRPMSFFEDPEPLAELREYLVALDKRQREPENNLDLPFSQYAWAGGMIWTRVPGERVKSYLDKYDEAPKVLAQLTDGKRGGFEVVSVDAAKLSVGEVVQIEWYNPDGEAGTFLSSLYDDTDVKIGSHHWNYPTHSLVQQQSLITAIKGNKVTLKDPLLHDVKADWGCQITAWNHLEEVGIEHFSIEFPMAPNIAHHVEDGYNAIYLTNLYNGWVRDIKIKNADSGVLTEQSSNVTIASIEISGDKKAHYSVSMGSVHNVLVENLTVFNEVMHPLSFNTHATKSVYKHCTIYKAPVLDQHSGVNHQNLFDDIKVFVTLPEDNLSYPLFAGGGAGYWKPSHGVFTTFWNIDVHFNNAFDQAGLVLLNGMKDGPSVRLIGVHANREIRIEYSPNPYIEGVNTFYRQVISLFEYQLRNRLN